MHVLLLGAKGQLGRAIQAVCPSGHNLVVWSHADADISEPAIIGKIIKLRPDIVINCAAWTNVDGAESNVGAAFAANALGAHYVATGCGESGATLVQISTNEVFAGPIGRFYYEYEQPAPASVYARSKAAGEAAVSRLLKELYIVRVAWLFGPGGNNFPAKIVAAADRHGALKVVNDEFGNPTYALDVAEAIFRLVDGAPFGIYHIVNQGHASRHEFAKRVLEKCGRQHIPVAPVRLADWPRSAPPPPHAVLVNQAAASLGITLRSWQEAVDEYAGAFAEMSKQ
jgi:dTDP-4-dehydrorhamnose reductase